MRAMCTDLPGLPTDRASNLESHSESRQSLMSDCGVIRAVRRWHDGIVRPSASLLTLSACCAASAVAAARSA